MINKLLSNFLLDIFIYNLIYHFYNDNIFVFKMYILLFIIKIILYIIHFFLSKKNVNNIYYYIGCNFINITLYCLIIIYMINYYSLSNKFIITNFLLNYFSSIILDNYLIKKNEKNKN
ncbi:hypothetical protein [Candidatus Karelsulcia muelleri]|uniref:hypothetical protein n=1 Tax=Candidatus Karelsulcia muelleri TaxID=336810 RepID=UPI0035C9240A